MVRLVHVQPPYEDVISRSLDSLNGAIDLFAVPRYRYAAGTVLAGDNNFAFRQKGLDRLSTEPDSSHGSKADLFRGSPSSDVGANDCFLQRERITSIRSRNFAA